MTTAINIFSIFMCGMKASNLRPQLGTFVQLLRFTQLS